MAGIISVCNGLLANNAACDCSCQSEQDHFFQNDICTYCQHHRAKHPPPTSTKAFVFKNVGYSFDRLLSVSLKPGGSVGIYEVTNQNQPLSVNVDGIIMPPRKYCAKVGPLQFLRNERDVGKVVTGNYIMPILNSFELEGLDGTKRLAAIIAPLYSGSMADILYKADAPEDEQIVSMLLCGMSAIYSFSSKGYAHRDIKLENLLKLNSYECVLGDFGSAAQLNPSGETETTANIGMNQKGITIAYDVTCLASAVGYMVLRRRLKFGGKNHLLREVENFVMYPVTLELLKSLTIDDTIKDSAELWNNWNELSLIAEQRMPNLFTRFPKLKPTPP